MVEFYLDKNYLLYMREGYVPVTLRSAAVF